MPLGEDKSTVTVVVSTELKEKIKKIAKIRRWTISQAVGALIEDSFDKWTTDLGIELKPVKTTKPRKPKPDKV
jgi:hypothetical protein